MNNIVKEQREVHRVVSSHVRHDQEILHHQVSHRTLVRASWWSRNVACSGLAVVCTTAPHSAELAGARADIRSQHLTFHLMRSLPMSAFHRLPRLQIVIGVRVGSISSLDGPP
jgi:hypothetical protein